METDTILVQKLIDLAVGQEKYTYPMQKNAPRPKNDYAAVKFIGMHRPGTDETKQIINGPDIIERTIGFRVLKYFILFSHDDELAETLQDSLYSDEVQEFMFKNKLAIMKLEKLDNDTLALETEWEVRTGYMLIFNRIRTVDRVRRTIHSVEGKGTYNGIPADFHVFEPQP